VCLDGLVGYNTHATAQRRYAIRKSLSIVAPLRRCVSILCESWRLCVKPNAAFQPYFQSFIKTCYMRRALILVGILICFKGYSQKNNIVLKFCPLALIDDISFPAIQGGIEFSLGKKMSWYNEVGIKYRRGYYEKIDTLFMPSKGFKIKTELRYYLGSNLTKKGAVEKLSGDYFAVNLFYTRDQHNTAINYHYQKDSSTIQEDNFGVKKTVWGANVLGGSQIMVSKRLMIDVYGGLGIRIRDIITINKEFDYARDGLRGPIDLNIPFIAQKLDAKGGSSLGATITMGVRICFRL
jgi:hypothetical protein